MTMGRPRIHQGNIHTIQFRVGSDDLIWELLEREIASNPGRPRSQVVHDILLFGLMQKARIHSEQTES